MRLKRRREDSTAVKVIKGVVTALLMLALLFVPAGTLRWPEAWILLIFYFTTVTGVMIWMKTNAPGLLKERMSRDKEMKRWDKIVMSAYSFLLIILLVVPGLDAVRFGWSKVPLIVKALGFIGYIPALGFAFWAMRENAFASDVVRIQEERSHSVCTTGPYRYVRHPMYTGVILFVLCFPLSLGSLYSFIPASLVIALFIIRTAMEDKTLLNELPGYKEYGQKVRFRLLPGVW
jgi:protein-S-isoprenylcysteine O-methyltransferase Ste14